MGVSASVIMAVIVPSIPVCSGGYFEPSPTTGGASPPVITQACRSVNAHRSAAKTPSPFCNRSNQARCRTFRGRRGNYH